jgi:hypothetical protein
VIARLIAVSALSIALTTTMATAAAAGRPHAVSVPGGRVTVTQRSTSTVLAYADRGRSRRIVLPAEEGIYADSLDGASLLGAVPGRVLILSTTYASRPYGGSHACGAGTETVIRVVALRPTLRQAFTTRVESCWTSVESGRIAWDPAARTLLVETYGGTAVGHAIKIYAVQEDGTVRLQSTSN